MALRTLGTNATTSLQCLVMTGAFNPQDFGNLKNLLKRNNLQEVPLLDPGGLEQSGLLKIPGGRGILQPQPGDVIAIDAATGWPILVAAKAIASGPWTLT